MGIIYLALKRVVPKAFFLFMVENINALSSTYSKGDGVTVVQTRACLEGSQETVISKFRAGEGNTLHSIYKRSKTYGYNPYDSIHLNFSTLGGWLCIQYSSGPQLRHLSTGGSLSIRGGIIVKTPLPTAEKCDISPRINPWFVTGFSDALQSRGCFMINFLKSPQYKVG